MNASWKMGEDTMPSNAEIHKEQEILEVRLNKVYMIIFLFFMFFFALNIVIAVQTLSFWEIELRFHDSDQWKLLGCCFLLIIFHEALHAFAAMMWGKAPWRSIHFGFKWQWMVFYCHCDKPLKIGIYRIFVIFPLIVTAPTAGLILWLDSSAWSLLLFCVTIAVCAGDILIFFKIRQVENDKWVQDHPSEIGCDILPESKINGG